MKLLDHEVDPGDHLGNRMLNLKPRVHFDEKELPILIKEFNGAGVAVIQRAHGFGDRLADLAALRFIQGGKTAFPP